MITENLKKRIYTSIVLFLIILLVLQFNVILIFSLIVLGVLSVLEFFNIIKKIIKNKFYLISFNIFFVMYVFIFCSTFFFFSNFLWLKIILFSILFACISSDIGGFIFGKIFKGPKLTKISPNKTYSGAIGSLIFSIIVFSSLIFYFTGDFNYIILIVGIIISVASQIGDLFFSFLKRKARIKDTGNILPGHGGVLDRLDGIFLGVPFGFLFLILFY
ncbi:phosphatidate cytidylyltransferase [Pelagibacteraceae bacterium]|jgi:phosphatidate cytidylyltransferase|nr:phosphatidate cytidylyltransferase [Pelagibacteraceae bacterium]